MTVHVQALFFCFSIYPKLHFHSLGFNQFNQKKLNTHVPLSLPSRSALPVVMSFDLSSNFTSQVYFSNLGSLDCSSADEFLAWTQVISKTFPAQSNHLSKCYIPQLKATSKSARRDTVQTQDLSAIYLPSPSIKLMVVRLSDYISNSLSGQPNRGGSSRSRVSH